MGRTLAAATDQGPGEALETGQGRVQLFAVLDVARVDALGRHRFELGEVTHDTHPEVGQALPEDALAHG